MRLVGAGAGAEAGKGARRAQRRGWGEQGRSRKWRRGGGRALGVELCSAPWRAARGRRRKEKEERRKKKRREGEEKKERGKRERDAAGFAAE